MGFFPSPPERALWAAGDDFRAGDVSAAAAALDPWVTRSAQVAREDLALRFLAQDYGGVLALAYTVPTVAEDDEARLWVARSDADLGLWNDCLVRLATLDRPDRPWALCLRAEALDGLSDPSAPAAYAAALSATAGTRLEAMCSVLAAENAVARGDDASAEALYERAEDADPAYTQVDMRLAELYLCEGRWQDARLRLERAHRVDPDAAEPTQDLDALLHDQPLQRSAQESDQDARLSRFARRPNPRVEPLAPLKGEPIVRIGLVSGADAFTLRVGGEMADEAGDLTLSAGSAWVACAGPGGTWTLAPLDPNPAPARVLSSPMRLVPLDPASTFGLFGVEHGSGYFFAGNGDRYYRGLLEIDDLPSGLLVVNELGLESYLCSVVPSEVPAEWSPAALRAQAIVARTYSWGTLGRYGRKGYDLCPTVNCAVYSGAGVEDPATTAAVTSTTGIVLEDGKRGLSSAHFMDNSGGHTLAAGDVWPGPDRDSVAVFDGPDNARATQRLFPLSASGLLHFIDDLDGDVQGWSADEGRSLWRWTLLLSPEELASGVDRRSPVGLPCAVQGLERSDGGYLKRVRIVGESGNFMVSGDRIRTALRGLKSDLFYVETRFDAQGRAVALLFHGGGWGHGVGMSQSGAQAMAKAGLDDHAILRHYFPEDRTRRRYTW
jgi:SpoIID/LytB domain protein